MYSDWSGEVRATFSFSRVREAPKNAPYRAYFAREIRVRREKSHFSAKFSHVLFLGHKMAQKTTHGLILG